MRLGLIGRVDEFHFEALSLEIEFRHLTYFVAVAQERSFHAGASRCGVSTPTVIRQLSQLECFLGVTLFLRSRQGVSLTQAGEQMLKEAVQVLDSQARMLWEMKGRVGRTIRLGYIAPSLFGPVGRALERGRARHPSVRFHLTEAHPGRQLELLADGHIDIGFVGHSDGRAPTGIRLRPLYSVPLAAVLRRDHPLARRSALHLRELQGEVFLGLKERLFPGRQAVVAETCRTAGLEVIYQELADSLISLLTLIGHGQGVSLVPVHAASIAHPQTVFVPLLDSPQPSINFHAAVSSQETRDEIEDLIALCQAEGCLHSCGQ